MGKLNYRKALELDSILYEVIDDNRNKETPEPDSKIIPYMKRYNPSLYEEYGNSDFFYNKKLVTLFLEQGGFVSIYKDIQQIKKIRSETFIAYGMLITSIVIAVATVVNFN